MEPDGAKNSVTITISKRTIFIVFAIIALIWLAFKLANLLVVLFVAIVFATAIDQPASWLVRHRIPRPIAVLAIYIAIAGILAGLVVALIPLVDGEIGTLQDRIPGYADSLKSLIQRVAPNASSTNLSVSKIASAASGHLTEIATRVTSFALATTHTIAYTFVMLVVAYFLAIDPDLGARVLERFAAPPTRDRIGAVAASIRLRIGAWARGQLLVAATLGVAMGVGLWLIGIPYAVSLGLTAGVLELIPYVGGAVTLLLAGLLAATIGWVQVVAVVVLYLVLVEIESHVLTPIFLGHAVGIPSIAVLIALLVGLELLGIIGVLLAVPATVIIWAIVEEVWPSPRVRTREASKVIHKIRQFRESGHGGVGVGREER